MPASSDRQFELAIAPSPGASAHGVAFWATKGERLDDAVLLINGVERWADLAFRTRTSSASLLTRLMQPSGSQGLRPWMASAGALVAWLLIGVALRAVATLPHDDAFGATLQ
jgi:hypothetical protein